MPRIVTTKRLGKYGPEHYADEATSVSRRAVATLEERLVFDSWEWELCGYDDSDGNGRFWHPALLLARYTREDGEELADVLFLHNGRISKRHVVRAMQESATIPESGGTVGPLPDGTMIEVEPMIERVGMILWLAENMPDLDRKGMSDAALADAFCDAYNARQS